LSAFSEENLTDTVKLGTLTVFTIALKAFEDEVHVRGVTFPTQAWGVWPTTMHWVSWPIRSLCAFKKEGPFISYLFSQPFISFQP